MKSFFLFFLFFWIYSLFGETSPQYTVKNVPAPPTKFKNYQIDGLTFLPNGKLVVCLPSGEIFFRDLKTESWELFAEGLHNPLGVIALSNSELIVTQRPELTRVRDLDGDGKADDFEVITDDFGMSGNYHEFNFTPVRDKQGNYFFALGTGSRGDGVRTITRGQFNERGRPGRMHSSAPYRGCIMKLTTEGKTIPWSYGHRTPNGLGFDLKGNLFVTDNQGDWVGSSKLFHVQKDHFYGHAASLAWKPDFDEVPLKAPVEKLAKMRSRACVVFPHGTMANSPTKVLAITPQAKMGPFTGQLLVGEMNRPRIMRVMLEKVGENYREHAFLFLMDLPWGADVTGWTGLRTVAFLSARPSIHGPEEKASNKLPGMAKLPLKSKIWNYRKRDLNLLLPNRSIVRLRRKRRPGPFPDTFMNTAKLTVLRDPMNPKWK
jgi:hypothetical protein